MEDLRRFAIYYDRFLRPENEPDQVIRNQLQRLQVVESATAYPFMLGLFEEHYHKRIERDELVESLEVLENYLVRRFLADETTGYTNKMFPLLLRDVSNVNLIDSLKQALLRRNYPSEARIRTILPSLQIYSRRNSHKRLVFVLETINHSLSRGSDGYTVLANDPTIEHIMPQKLTTDWRQTLGQDSDTTYRDLLHTIGNLTLVTQNWNTALSNDRWPKKRKMLAEHALRMNQAYFADITGDWDRNAIEQRAQWLTNMALQIWPTLGEIPVGVGYKGSTPEALVILSEYYDVGSWRDVARQAIHFALREADNFEDFATNLQSTYVSVEHRARAEQLPNGWWVYLNLSADSVMTLCKSIFETLGLSDEDWDVKLQD